MSLRNIAIIVGMLNIQADTNQAATTTATTTTAATTTATTTTAATTTATTTTAATTTTVTNCPDPLGVPNAYIVTSSPYTEGDLVTYRCYTGFTMTGAPSQTCGSSGTWQGNEPTCAPVDMSDTVNQNVNYTDTPFTMPEWSIILVCVVAGMILLLICALIVAAICSMCRCRRCCSCEDAPERKAVTHVRNNSRVVTVSPAPEVPHDKPRLASIVQKVMDNRSAKDVKTWMPHSNPVRPINTSTK